MLAAVKMETSKAGHLYESDDYGYPIEPDSTYQRGTWPGKVLGLIRGLLEIYVTVELICETSFATLEIKTKANR